MLQAELAKLSSLSNVGIALAEFSLSLIAGAQFSRDSQGRYVTRPHNFVTFKVHSARAKNITVTLRGNPREFSVLAELPLKPDQNGYSSFKLTNPKQLAAAALYIRRAAELYNRGRTRPQKKQVILET